ncbi:MAG: efflux RND transporter periplasmic adaptor subunit [Pseudomonadota bacterium]
MAADKGRRPLRWLLVGLGMAAIVAVVVVYRIASAPLPQGLLQVNGRIEGDTTTVAAKYPGKVKEIMAKEGDLVEVDQVLVQMEDEEVKAKMRQADAGIASLETRRQAANETLAVAKKELPLGIAAAQAQVDHMQATVEKAQAAEGQFSRDLERVRVLAEAGTVNKQRLEQAQLQYTVMTKDIRSARAGLTGAQKQLERANLGKEQIAAKETELKALDSELDRVRAMREEAAIALANLTVKAPSKGIVTSRLVEAGEVGAAGRPLYELVNLDRLYLKVYVPGNEIGKIRRGLQAQVYVDSYPNRPFPAVVDYIASRAEFTPKEVQTPDERVKQVYAVKLYFTGNPDFLLTPGMPADAVIRWDENVAWAPPKW